MFAYCSVLATLLVPRLSAEPATVLIGFVRADAITPFATYADGAWHAGQPADMKTQLSWHRLRVHDEQFAQVAVAGRVSSISFERATSDDRTIVDEVASDARRAERGAADSWNAHAANTGLAMQYPVRDADRAAARLDVHAFVRTAGKVEGQSWWYLEGEKRYPREVKYEWSDRPCVALSRVRGVIHARKGPRVIMTDAEASDDCSTDTTTVPLVALVIRGETYWVVRRESDGQHDYVLMRIVDGFPQAVEMSRR